MPLRLPERAASVGAALANGRAKRVCAARVAAMPKPRRVQVTHDLVMPDRSDPDRHVDLSSL